MFTFEKHICSREGGVREGFPEEVMPMMICKGVSQLKQSMGGVWGLSVLSQKNRTPTG